MVPDIIAQEIVDDLDAAWAGYFVASPVAAKKRCRESFLARVSTASFARVAAVSRLDFQDSC